MAEPYYIPIGGVPVTFTKPEQRLKQAQELIDKYLKPQVEVEKVALRFEAKDWLPILLGIGGLILILRLIK